MVARQAHNLEVACSSPASATTEVRFYRTFFVFYGKTLHMLPVAVLRRAKRPFGPSASLASATTAAYEAAFFVIGYHACLCHPLLESAFSRAENIVSLGGKRWFPWWECFVPNVGLYSLFKHRKMAFRLVFSYFFQDLT